MSRIGQLLTVFVVVVFYPLFRLVSPLAGLISRQPIAAALISAMAALGVTEAVSTDVADWWARHPITAGIVVYFLGLGLVYLVIDDRLRARWTPVVARVSQHLEPTTRNLVAGLMLVTQWPVPEDEPSDTQSWASGARALDSFASPSPDASDFATAWVSRLSSLSGEQRARAVDQIESRSRDLSQAVLDSAPILVAGGAHDLLDAYQQVVDIGLDSVRTLRSRVTWSSDDSAFFLFSVGLNAFKSLGHYKTAGDILHRYEWEAGRRTRFVDSPVPLNLDP
jgi:hypothetical protein